jgi:hypothetical protein
VGGWPAKSGPGASHKGLRSSFAGTNQIKFTGLVFFNHLSARPWKACAPRSRRYCKPQHQAHGKLAEHVGAVDVELVGDVAFQKPLGSLAQVLARQGRCLAAPGNVGMPHLPDLFPAFHPICRPSARLEIWPAETAIRPG